MALKEALIAWRRTRHPRWAAVVEALGKTELAREVVGAGRKKGDTAAWNALAEQGDARDLPRLFAALLTTSAGEAAERLGVLAKLDDPRLTTLILSALEAPVWRANVFKGFVTQALAVIERSRDVRARDVLRDLAPRYKAIIETSVGDWVGTKLLKAVEAMAAIEPGPLTPADEKALAALEGSLPVTTPVKKKPGKDQSDEALLSLIYASPDDDQPRLVFADALSERGDVRGEFISLQLARAQGRATVEQFAREEELAFDPKRRTGWALPLANGGDCTFGRGFPERIKLKASSAKKIVGEPAWATIRRVEGLEGLSVRVAAQLLDHPTLARVRAVHTLTPKLGAALALVPRQWTSVRAHFAPTAEQTATWAVLEQLELWSVEPRREVTAAVLLPLTKLVELTIDERMLAPGALSAVPKLKRFHLLLERTPAPAALLGPLESLEHLELSAASDLPLGDVFSQVTKSVRTLSLSANYLEREQVAAGLAAMPNVERLELASPEWATVDIVAALIAGTRVRTVTVRSGLGWWELDGSRLTLRQLGWDRPPERLLGAKLPKGLVEQVHFPERFDAAALARVEGYLTGQGLKLAG